MVKLIDFCSGGGDGCIELDYADVVRLGLDPRGDDPAIDWVVSHQTICDNVVEDNSNTVTVTIVFPAKSVQLLLVLKLPQFFQLVSDKPRTLMLFLFISLQTVSSLPASFIFLTFQVPILYSFRMCWIVVFRAVYMYVLDCSIQGSVHVHVCAGF